jgi:hypothetical protein
MAFFRWCNFRILGVFFIVNTQGIYFGWIYGTDMNSKGIFFCGGAGRLYKENPVKYRV